MGVRIRLGFLTQRLSSIRRKGRSRVRKPGVWLNSISSKVDFQIFKNFLSDIGVFKTTTSNVDHHINPYSLPEPSSDCCGQRVPIRVMAVFIGILELIALLINCIVIRVVYSRLPPEHRLIYAYSTPLAFPEVALAVSVSALACGAVFISIMIWGLHTERAVLLIPHLLGEIAAGVGLLVLIAFLSIYTAATHYEDRDQAATMTLINFMMITLCVFALLLIGWFFFYSLACYRYVKCRERYRKEQSKGSVVKYDNRFDGGSLHLGHLEAIAKNDSYGSIL